LMALSADGTGDDRLRSTTAACCVKLNGTKRKQVSMVNPNIIKHFEIQGLFGLHDYTLDFGGEHGARQESLLYGDNGTGKTTILKLMYHLLSKKPGEGSRTYLSQTPFRRLYMELAAGQTIELNKGEELTLAFHDGSETKIIGLNPDPEDQSIKSTTNSELVHYEKFLEALKIEQLYLSDDRVIMSSYRRFDRRRRMMRERYLEDDDPRLASAPLESIDLNALAIRVRDIVREQLIDSSAYGQSNVNNIYLDLAKRLSSPAGAENASSAASVEEIERRAKLIARDYSVASSLEIFPSVDFDEFVNVARHSSPHSTSLAVIETFLDTVEAQVKAVIRIAQLLNALVNEINSYLVNKRISFASRSGLRIFSNKRRLRLQELSSGERQLLFLMFVSFVTRDDKSIVYIDEPELSLNIKWQRQLISSILKIIGGTETQLIAATHSFEILAKHRESIINLNKDQGSDS
jgi:ABC-type Mn2+/Zn2+ transport system ATPase subunit